MNYEDAVEFLNGLVDYEKLGLRREFGRKVNLDSMKTLAAELGNPHEGLPAVHIAGTKGKGSVAAFVETITRAAGYRTGLFTSPHIVSPRERIRINGKPISKEELTGLVEEMAPPVQKIREHRSLTSATFFEVYTGMGFLHFARHNVDLAIIETGLGGRLDATNIIDPLVCAITTLGLDHTKILGDTIEQIAAEKAGIIKPGVPVVLAPNASEAELVVEDHAREVQAPLRRPPDVVRADPPGRLPIPSGGETFEPPKQSVILQRGEQQAAYEIGLLGRHQATNFAVAVGIADALAGVAGPGGNSYEIDEKDISAGARDTYWPGRLEIIRARPWIVADCAHNEQSARALAEAVPPLLEYDRLLVVLGMSRDKDAGRTAAALAPVTDIAVLTRARLQRAMPVHDLHAATEHHWPECYTACTVPEAIKLAEDLAGPRDCILVTGSFFVVGEFMELLFHKSV